MQKINKIIKNVEIIYIMMAPLILTIYYLKILKLLNIKLYNLRKKYSGIARNLGIRKSKGKRLSFLI